MVGGAGGGGGGGGVDNYLLIYKIVKKLRRKLLKSSPEPLGQFNQTWYKTLLSELKFVQMKGPGLFYGEIIMK